LGALNTDPERPRPDGTQHSGAPPGCCRNSIAKLRIADPRISRFGMQRGAVTTSHSPDRLCRSCARRQRWTSCTWALSSVLKKATRARSPGEEWACHSEDSPGPILLGHNPRGDREGDEHNHIIAITAQGESIRCKWSCSSALNAGWPKGAEIPHERRARTPFITPLASPPPPDGWSGPSLEIWGIRPRGTGQDGRGPVSTEDRVLRACMQRLRHNSVSDSDGEESPWACAMRGPRGRHSLRCSDRQARDHPRGPMTSPRNEDVRSPRPYYGPRDGWIVP
jgi:hypothetical protein